MKSIWKLCKLVMSVIVCLSLSICLINCTSVRIYAAKGEPLGEQFTNSGDVILDNSSIASVSSGPSEDVVFELDAIVDSFVSTR